MSSALKFSDEDNREWLITKSGFIRHYTKYCNITFLNYFHMYHFEDTCTRCGKLIPEIIKIIARI